jgi:uncharacterized membrane protein YcaP (DUF421 family)
MLSMRILGKRQMGELEISELVVAVVIADIAVIPLQDIGIPLINGIIPIIILLCCEILITGAAVKSVRLRLLLFGRPSILIENGVINQKEMKKNRFTIDELYEELRQQSITDITKVERAILETNGILNVILLPKEQPPTCKQLGIRCPEESCPIILINEGRIMEDNLRKTGKDLQWLNRYLRNNHIRAASDVYLLSLDKTGKYYLSISEDPT